MAHELVERELKYEVGEGFSVPELGDVANADRIERADQRLDSVYFDTDRHDLLARGVTLRLRTGTADNGWQLKVPAGDARTEIRLDPTGRDTTVPKELSALVAGLRRGRSLRHVVTVRTDRTARRVLNADGALLVEVADDRVQAVAPGRQSATLSSWREVEAELGPAGTEDLLAAVDDRLRAAGATASASANKVARALGAGDVDRPATPADHGATAGAVITAYLREQDDALVAGDLSLRRGLGGIHPTRVATRRLRSTLRIFADFVDADRAAAFDAELSWYADLLGEVRDREVQRERFAAAVANLPDDLVLGPVAARIEQQLLTEQLAHETTLRKAMTGRRYLALLRESGRWATDPPLTDLADRKVATLRRAVTAAERKVRKHLAAGNDTGDDDELHKARKAGKRARYAAELARPVLGKKKAKRAIKRYEDLQDILGDHQDGVVAAELLRRLAAATAGDPTENGFTYGLLFAHEQHRAERSRQAARAWSP